MGLDQYSYTREKAQEPNFYWRKHSQLQTFMEDIWFRELGNEDDFNCKELVLGKEHIEDLLHRLNSENLPKSEGGFFYGEQFQDESSKEYHKQDVKFCKDSLKAIDDGKEVIYSCWY